MPNDRPAVPPTPSAEERECLNGLLREERKIVRSSTLREVRYAVLFEIVGEATDGDRLLRESDILAGLAKMEGK